MRLLPVVLPGRLNSISSKLLSNLCPFVDHWAGDVKEYVRGIEHRCARSFRVNDAG